MLRSDCTTNVSSGPPRWVTLKRQIAEHGGQPTLEFANNVIADATFLDPHRGPTRRRATSLRYGGAHAYTGTWQDTDAFVLAGDNLYGP